MLDDYVQPDPIRSYKARLKILEEDEILRNFLNSSSSTLQPAFDKIENFDGIALEIKDGVIKTSSGWKDFFIAQGRKRSVGSLEGVNMAKEMRINQSVVMQEISEHVDREIARIKNAITTIEKRAQTPTQAQLKIKQREYYKEYYKKNKEKMKLYAKKYIQDNKEYVKDYHKRYYQNNKEEIKSHNENYCKFNVDKLRDYHEKYYKENKERLNSYGRDYSRKYREKMKKKKEDIENYA